MKNIELIDGLLGCSHIFHPVMYSQLKGYDLMIARIQIAKEKREDSRKQRANRKKSRRRKNKIQQTCSLVMYEL